MQSATFLLVINLAIGLSFATAFLALTARSGVRLGRWCAAGFLLAAATVTVEAFAAVLPSVRLTSLVSFGLLLASLTTIAAGLVRHYRPATALVWFAVFLVLSLVLNALVVFDMPRGTWGQGLGYQGPYCAVLAFAAGFVVFASRRRPVDLALAAILSLCAAQFLAKAGLAAWAGSGPGVRDYVVSRYAFYSQTAGGILSLFLGLSLVGLVVTEVMEEAAERHQRDDLSGLLNRKAFFARLSAARSRAGPACVVLCDLDRFKSINDGFGHAAGDEVIRAYGALLRGHLGESIPCGRLGGEEFCFVLPGEDPAAIPGRIEALRRASRQIRYRRLPVEFAVTASFGIAIAEPDEPFEEALHRADMALYAAKAAGRDTWRFAEPRAGVPMPLHAVEA